MENRKTYKVEIREVESEEYKDIRDYFSCFEYQIYEDGENLGYITIDGVNTMMGLPALLRCLAEKLDPDHEEE